MTMSERLLMAEKLQSNSEHRMKLLRTISTTLLRYGKEGTVVSLLDGFRELAVELREWTQEEMKAGEEMRKEVEVEDA